MASPLASFEAWSDATAKQLVMFMNPNVPYPNSPTHAWPLSKLHECLYASAAYLLLVGVGVVLKWRATGGGASGKTGAAEGDVADGDTRKSKGARKLATWGDVANSFIADPLKFPLALYNVVQIVLCGWMTVAALTRAHALGYSVICNTFDATDTVISEVEWVFYVSKALDFVDTVFIIARGKWSQLSFLHTYHHLSIFMTYWVVNAAAYSGDVYLPVAFNAFIHFLMYTHYLATCLLANAWWAPYLTQLQMFQFVFMNAHGIYMLAAGCEYPPRVTVFYLVYIFLMLCLFMNFYIGKHCRGGRAKAAKAE